MDSTISEIYIFIITGILLSGILTGFIVYFIISYYKKQQKNVKEKQLLQAKFNEDLLNSKIEIQERAFSDISRELHDNVGQQLSAANMYLNLALKDPQHIDAAKLQSCQDIISESLQDIRQISQTLLGEKISGAGITESIKTEISKINKLGICTAFLEIKEQEPKTGLDPKKEIILFRIIQEALNNATKHTPGCHIHIKIEHKAHQLTIEVSDNGKGFNAQSNSEGDGIGLLNMRNRAQTIGADYKLHSHPGQGTKIEIKLPGNS